MILISDPDKSWSSKLTDFLKEKQQDFDVCSSGKECQLYVFKKNPATVILDIDTSAHSGLEVLKYLRLNYPKTKVVLTFPSDKRFKELDFSKPDLMALGVSEIQIKPYSIQKLYDNILSGKKSESWKEIIPNEKPKDDSNEINARDDDFTRIKFESFLTGNTTIFDFYIRLASNRYVKVLHKGDFFNDSQIKRFSAAGKVDYLYFRTNDRIIYINFINKLLEKSILSGKGDATANVMAAKGLVEKYIEEVYIQGLNPDLVEEGLKICQNMYNLVQKEKGLNTVLKELEIQDPSSYSHSFLVSFISTVICKNLDWASGRTVELIAMGAMLHDIGKLKLPVSLREKPVDLMSADEFAIYKNHPLYGVELLSKFPSISEPVKQIVFQHHEYVNGQGFPNGLSGVKIYPLAKVVSLANIFSELMVTQKVTPFEALKLFIPNRELTDRYDPILIKALVAGFAKRK